MPRFETKFVDGKTLVTEGQNRDEAKAKAKQERRAKLPAGAPGSAPEVKVVSITPLDERNDSNRQRDERGGESRDSQRDERGGNDRQRDERGEGNNG